MELARNDARFLSELRAAQQVEATPGVSAALWLMLALVVAAIAWAALARVDQVTTADARVVPDGREQVIASLEGGLLAELLVREGMTVKAGQPLARLDPTRFETQVNEGEAKRLALHATAARLEAESRGAALQFPKDVAAQPRLVAAETEAYQARRRALDEGLAANRRSVELLGRELAVAQRMAAQGLMSEVEVMRLQRQINEQTLQGQERTNRFRQDASTERLRVRAELAQLDEQMAGRSDVLRRTVLSSPVDGVVKNIRVNTVGGVLQPGAPLLEIVPASERLLVEARVKPGEIGFLRVGQAAELKLAAYEAATYGGLPGTIEHISPDAIGDPDKAPNGADPTYYRVLVRTASAALHAQGKDLPVIPGMTGSVDLHTGERTVLEFLLRPVLKSREAFRER
ncbi:MAG TPA: HlyD family type I secretion periplasmic adaptor subunit [Methylibium sp.]|nr:HlyD family type I secretion periplasmic adaptor subunit [Methylibium sp.]